LLTKRKPVGIYMAGTGAIPYEIMAALDRSSPNVTQVQTEPEVRRTLSTQA